MTLEQPELTDEMRHVPSLDWMINKLDYDTRDRIETVWQSAHSTDDVDAEIMRAVDAQFRSLDRWLQRIVTLARGKASTTYQESDLHTSLTHSVYEAVTALEGMDRSTFRRRIPYHQFQFNRSEMIWESFLAAGTILQKLSEAVSLFEPDLPMKLLAQHAPAEPKLVEYRNP